MTDKCQFPFPQAEHVARMLCEDLRPHCERIEIAGSLRRRKPTVGDIELLFVPKTSERMADLLEKETFSQADVALGYLILSGVLGKRPNAKGGVTWGPLNKLAVHRASGIPVDFFAEPRPEEWYRSLVIRTGPSRFNIRLIQTAKMRGIQVHAYQSPGLVEMRSGKPIPCASEREFIEACGVRYLESWNRV